MEGEKVPDDYVSKNNPIAERQVVLAGYRLAHLIEYLFTPKHSEVTEEVVVIEEQLFLQEWRGNIVKTRMFWFINEEWMKTV